MISRHSKNFLIGPMEQTRTFLNRFPRELVPHAHAGKWITPSANRVKDRKFKGSLAVEI